MKREREQCLRKNCITETTSSSCQSATPRQHILHPRHSILNEELITGFIRGRGKQKKKKKKP